MAKFAFVIHPIHARDVARKYPIARIAPTWLIEAALRRINPWVVSEIHGVQSIQGQRTEGWFIGCPLTPSQMVGKVPLEEVYGSIARCCEIGADLGADLIGLGAFTSVVGDGGLTIAKRSPIPVTTGNSYTVATAIDGVVQACDLVGANLEYSTLAVVGATGSIGKTCAVVLSRRFAKTILIGRDLARTTAIAGEIPKSEATDSYDRLIEADAVVTVTSSESAVILPEHLKPGAVVCDVARPRDVSQRVAKERPDVLVIEGGVVKPPGDVNFNLNFGFPPGMAYACMSETMMLALEADPTLYSFTLGKDVTEAQVRQINGLAAKHGFKLAGFRSFEKTVDPTAIEAAKKARLMSGTISRSAVV